MKFVNIATLLAVCFLMCRRSSQPMPFVPGVALDEKLARINVILFLSSCTPCSSTVVTELADFLRTNRGAAGVTIIANRFAPHALDVVPPLFDGITDVRFILDKNGTITRGAGVPALPFLVVFDDGRRMLRAEAISPVAAAHAHLSEELTALYVVPNN